MERGSKSDFRNLPGVDRLLADPRLGSDQTGLSRNALTSLVRDVMAEARGCVAGGEPCPSYDELISTVTGNAARIQHSLRKVINATGVVLHTNLGRAPLSEETVEAMARASQGYVNLEFNLESGQRGSRHDHLDGLLRLVTGAEAGLVVNNNASAVLLGLTALAKGKEVIVSRGHAVQIGGGVRIPDIMRQSGAKLVEVGTTNVTTAADYANATTDKTAAVLRVHSSNFKLVGFTEQPGISEIAVVAHGKGLVALDDIGSGCLINPERYGLGAEPMVQESLAAGIDLVFFSGDKLLGGPQAGIVVGKRELVEKLKRHPMARAVRVDKTRIAGLAATLLHYARGEAEAKIPVWKMISLPLSTLEDRASRWAATIPGAAVQPGESLVGGGSLPGSSIPTCLVCVKETAKGNSRKRLPIAVQRLRSGDPSIICRIEKDALLIDPRTVHEQEEGRLLSALRAALADAD